MTVTARDVKAARAAVETVARRTPMLSTRTFSERAGGTVALKAENLQRTGSFKVRGVAAKLDALGHEGCKNGVIAASAGNHAQALAAGAAARGVHCEVVVPVDAPMAKVEAARRYGAIVHTGGKSVDECIVIALEKAEAEGLAFVHPFDDPAIVAGQGSLGLELLEDVPDLAQVVIPIGGGGLCAGTALAIKDAKPHVKIIGVQAAACAPYPESMQAGTPIEAKTALTIADGIAVKRPGGIPLAILRTHLDDLVVVNEEATAAAMALLLERCKLVVEGAGAVGIAALLGGQVEPVDGTTVAVSERRQRRRRPARRHRAPARDRSRAPARRAHPHPRPAGWARHAARRRRRDGREHRRRQPRPRRPRPARAGDGGRDGPRDARSRPRADGPDEAPAGGLRNPGHRLTRSRQGQGNRE